MAYKLKSGVYLVEGALNGALLDTNTGSVYSVNEQACKVLTYGNVDDPYWQTLISLNLAEEVDLTEVNLVTRKDAEFVLKFVWFEIVTDACNERCEHCYADSMPRAYRKHLGVEDRELTLVQEKPRLTYAQWLSFIEEAYALGCRRCQFIGGEPFLFKGPANESVLDLCEYAMSLGYESVEVFTNGTLITEEKVERIKRLNIKVAISLYSDQAAVHDSITRTPGSFEKTTRAMKILKESGIQLRVETVDVLRKAKKPSRIRE